ncbi:Scr1 family TA system antitoxin-like transcriptional regulator [Kitasatospora phosalacinea]|uniref:Scr1 family TA system antitoxin-like transcriptional regulator n=1 Tax=Kitasatospora phosalacinea TaxID=2065 RepID=UPI00069145C5|nr:Scr1 family TA system antitoxin-like transcriptional regulator [Kitasatospora phosalacinea]
MGESPADMTPAAFGWLLEVFREKAGLKKAGLAREVHCDPSLISRFESGERVPAVEMVHRIDRLLGADGLLVNAYGRVGWYREVAHPEWFQVFAEREARAEEVRRYSISLIPGPCQEPGYAAAVFKRRQINPTPDWIEARVAARISRQARFLADDGPLLSVVLDEAVIRRAVGGPQVMHRQLDHLLALMRRPNIVIQVAPLELGDRTPAGTSFTLLTMPDGQRHLYSESLTSGHFTTDPDEITYYSRAYDWLRGHVLSVPDSAALIRQVMKGLVNSMSAQRSDIEPLRPLAWFKSSSYSDHNGGDCVQPALNLAGSHGAVLVRDSKDPQGPVLSVSPAAWSAFVEAAGRGGFGGI